MTYIYIPRTQMTLVLGGWPSKIEVIGALGSFFCLQLIMLNMKLPKRTAARVTHGFLPDLTQKGGPTGLLDSWIHPGRLTAGSPTAIIYLEKKMIWTKPPGNYIHVFWSDSKDTFSDESRWNGPIATSERWRFVRMEPSLKNKTNGSGNRHRSFPGGI